MKNIYALLIISTLSACSIKDSTPDQVVNQAEKRQIIETMMQKQEDAWNKGDLEGFMQAYWKSDSLMFIGSRGLNYGWETTLSNYQKSYPNNEAMGQLEFENLKFKDLSEEYSFMIGRWHLYRSADTLEGSYSLLWKWDGKTPHIVADHSS